MGYRDSEHWTCDQRICVGSVHGTERRVARNGHDHEH
jgi:hypothetical protein